MQFSSAGRSGSEPLELRPSEGRVPPHDLGAEAAVLSAALLSNEAFDQVNELLLSEHFYSQQNRLIYEAIAELQRQHSVVDVVRVAGWLRDRGRLEQVGGTPYLAQLTDATPAVAHAPEHARVIREKYRLRQLIATCQKFAAEGYVEAGEVQDFIDGAEQAIFDIARVSESSPVQLLSEAVKGAFKVLTEASQRAGKITGVPTGFEELDTKIAGMHKGDLYIVAGRPGMGKTSFVLNVAANSARPRRIQIEDLNTPLGESTVEEPGMGVAFFSLEMPREQLAARMLASEARVNVASIRSGHLADDDWNRLTEAASHLGRLPVWIDDTPAISVMDLRAKVRRLQADVARSDGTGPKASRLGVVVIDYLQLMQGRRGVNSREQEISEISRGLKQLAKEMEVSVIALSQLNRSVESRNDKRPQLSDLRESGAIEQDADAIFFIYRDEYYHENSPDVGQAEVIVAKQRNGPTGTVKVRFESAYTRFDNLAPDEWDIDEYDNMA